MDAFSTLGLRRVNILEKIMYLTGGSVVGAVIALLVVVYLVKNWWSK